MRRLIYIVSALAGCADILGIRDPVLDPDARVIDAPMPPPDDAPIIIDASPQVDVLAPVDAVPQLDARVCDWTYAPTNFESCSLPATNGAGEELAKLVSAGVVSCAKRCAASLECRIVISSKFSAPHRLQFMQTARR